MFPDNFLPAIDNNNIPIQVLEKSFIMVKIPNKKANSQENRFYRIVKFFNQFNEQLFKIGELERDEYDYMISCLQDDMANLKADIFEEKIQTEEEEKHRVYIPEDKMVYEKDVQDWYPLEIN